MRENNRPGLQPQKKILIIAESRWQDEIMKNEKIKMKNNYLTDNTVFQPESKGLQSPGASAPG